MRDLQGILLIAHEAQRDSIDFFAILIEEEFEGRVLACEELFDLGEVFCVRGVAHGGIRASRVRLRRRAVCWGPLPHDLELSATTRLANIGQNLGTIIGDTFGKSRQKSADERDPVGALWDGAVVGKFDLNFAFFPSSETERPP